MFSSGLLRVSAWKSTTGCMRTTNLGFCSHRSMWEPSQVCFPTWWFWTTAAKGYRIFGWHQLDNRDQLKIVLFHWPLNVWHQLGFSWLYQKVGFVRYALFFMEFYLKCTYLLKNELCQHWFGFLFSSLRCEMTLFLVSDIFPILVSLSYFGKVS